MGWPALLWVAAGVAGVGALAAAAGGGGGQSGADDLKDGGNFDGWVPPQKAFVQVEDEVEVVSGHTTKDVDDGWNLDSKGKCRKADDQSLPIVGLWNAIPQQVRVGPIAAAIEGGIGIVQGVFAELGWKRVCSVRGGQYFQAKLVHASAVKPWVRIAVGFVGHPENHVWVWQDDEPVVSTGELTLKSNFDSYVPGPRSEYLGRGGAPPGNMWPHVAGIARWAASVSPELEQPRVELVRTGGNFRLMVWLPPRAPLSKLEGPMQRYKVERKVRWKIEYAIEKVA